MTCTESVVMTTVSGTMTVRTVGCRVPTGAAPVVKAELVGLAVVAGAVGAVLV